MVIVIAGTMLPANAVVAKEQEDKYPYTMFAASDKEGAITVNAGNFCVNGNIAANGTIVSSGNMNLNGTKTEHANLKMLHITESLKKDYFTGDSVVIKTGDYNFEETNVNINSPMDIGGEAVLSGNISLNAGIMAQGDITLKGGVINTNNSIICSKTGNITVDSSNVNLNGLIYAPHGRVKFTSQNLNLNNIIIIADSITLKCSGANVNYSTGMGKVVGTAGDADGDGLTDYQEACLTETDPLKYDSVKKGISDAEADSDEDGLSNIREVGIGN